jgi:hypothetical protein
MMNEKEWLTAKGAAEATDRSIYTIYTWIRRTKEGVAENPLTLKKAKNGRAWLIGVNSLIKANGSSLKLRTAMGSGINTSRGVNADRERWVKGWVSEGKTLERILDVFSSNLHQEIREYYYRFK